MSIHLERKVFLLEQKVDSLAAKMQDWEAEDTAVDAIPYGANAPLCPHNNTSYWPHMCSPCWYGMYPPS